MFNSVGIRGVAVLLAVLAAAVTAPAAAAAPAPAACASLPATLPAPGALPAISELPDPFRFWDGARMTSPDEWTCRRAQLSELAQYYEYGHLPSASTSVTGVRNGNTLTVNVTANGRAASFNATLRLPAGNGPFPAIIMLNPLAASATSRGYAEVLIDPNSIAADSTAKTGAFWTLHNGSDAGVLMAWAWGVHRTLDALGAVPQIDTTRVGVSGYSRYGKAAVVAGAFDQRIALTVPGSSGTAGMGNFRYFFTGGANDETLDGILGAAYWFTPRFAQFRGQANRLPVDQNSVAALIAPRLLLTTSGTEGSDIRTNPQGTSLTHRAAKMVYTYLGAPARIGINYRPGGHQLDLNDYNAVMDFADKYLRSLPVSRTFDNVPYPNSSAAIPWQIPSGNPDPGPDPTAACRVAYDMTPWNTGFTTNIAVTNTGAGAVNGWALRFTLPAGQTITGGWNANYAPATGAITATNVGHNAAIPPGGTVTFGFQATHNGTTTKPTTFTLNNSPCTT